MAKPSSNKLHKKEVTCEFRILTQCAFKAKGTDSYFILQQKTGRKCIMLLPTVLWSQPSHGPCCARDIVYFTTDLQTVIYYSTIHCLGWPIS